MSQVTDVFTMSKSIHDWVHIISESSVTIAEIGHDLRFSRV